MELTIIKQKGLGMGSGNSIEVLAKKEIIKIVENISNREIFMAAYNKYRQGNNTGNACIDLKTGNLYSLH